MCVNWRLIFIGNDDADDDEEDHEDADVGWWWWWWWWWRWWWWWWWWWWLLLFCWEDDSDPDDNGDLLTLTSYKCDYGDSIVTMVIGQHSSEDSIVTITPLWSWQHYDSGFLRQSRHLSTLAKHSTEFQVQKRRAPSLREFGLGVWEFCRSTWSLDMSFTNRYFSGNNWMDVKN